MLDDNMINFLLDSTMQINHHGKCKMISCTANLDDFDHNPGYSGGTNRMEVIFDGILTRKCGGA